MVGIFPSGTRSTEDVSLKAGAVTIAMRSNVPLIPAAYVGPSSVKRINKGKKAQLIFGDPIQIDAEEQIDRKTAMKMMTDQLNEKFEEPKGSFGIKSKVRKDDRHRRSSFLLLL